MKGMSEASRVLLFAIFSVFLWFSCSSKHPAAPISPSGFLKDYSMLVPSKQVEGAYTYSNPGKTISLYKMIIVEPVEVHPSEASGGGDVEPDAMDKLARRFETELRSVLKDSYPIVDRGGFGVLRVRSAITGVSAGTPVLGPVTNVFGIGLGGASIEAELIDSRSGETVIAFVDSRTGRRLPRRSGLTKYGQAEELLHYWAMALRDALDEARGLHSADTFRTTGDRFRTGW